MVNNFIDLVADDIVILKATPHGKFIDQYQKEIDNIDEAINNSRTLILEKKSDRDVWQSYKYGSCVLYGDYMLTVLTTFNV